MSILLAVLVAWLVVSLLIVALLIAARRDDDALHRQAPAGERQERSDDDVAA
jgi:hypothetical protein